MVNLKGNNNNNNNIDITYLVKRMNGRGKALRHTYYMYICSDY